MATITAGLLAALDQETGALARRVQQSVVSVRSGRARGRDGRGQAWAGAGSGIVWRADGLIVTNNHVVGSDEVEIELPDGQRRPGRVVARRPEDDLAAIQVAGGGLTAAPIGDSTALRVGQLVLAVGHPWGLKGAVTTGIVSTWNGADSGRELICAHLDVRPGNSGGPMVDAQSRVIGVNAMLVGPRVALAVPSHVVQRFVGSPDPVGSGADWL